MSANGTKRTAGRPRIIESPEEFDRLVEEYRAECKRDEVPVTFTGMALHLGFCNRRSFYDYATYEGFSLPVQKAMALVECEYEKRLAGQNVAGAIFALKNHGWTDRQDLTHAGPDGGPIKTQEVDELRRTVTSRIAGIASRIGSNGAHRVANGNGANGSRP